MDMEEIRSFLGTPGTVAFIGLVVGFLVRLIKTDKMNDFLAKFSIPAIPKAALPWIALVLGVVGMQLDVYTAGSFTWKGALVALVNGVFAGGFAVVGDQTLPKAVAKMSPGAANLIFGASKKTPPTAPPAPPPSTEVVITEVEPKSENPLP